MSRIAEQKADGLGEGWRTASRGSQRTSRGLTFRRGLAPAGAGMYDLKTNYVD